MKGAAQKLSSLLNIDVVTDPLVPFVVIAHGSGPHDVQYDREGEACLALSNYWLPRNTIAEASEGFH